MARIVPIISSFSYEASDLEHCNETLSDAFRFDLVLIAVGTLCFVTIPAPVLHVFVSDERVVEVGQIGFRFIGVSFLPMVTTLIFPVYFLSSLFSSRRGRLAEFPALVHSCGRSIRPAWLPFLTVWTELVPAHFSGQQAALVCYYIAAFSQKTADTICSQTAYSIFFKHIRPLLLGRMRLF